MSYATFWCGKVRKESAINSIYTDPHSPFFARVLVSTAAADSRGYTDLQNRGQQQIRGNSRKASSVKTRSRFANCGRLILGWWYRHMGRKGNFRSHLSLILLVCLSKTLSKVIYETCIHQDSMVNQVYWASVATIGTDPQCRMCTETSTLPDDEKHASFIRPLIISFSSSSC